MLDYGAMQMQMPLAYNIGQADLMPHHPQVAFHPAAMHLVAPQETILPPMPEIHAVPPLITPLETPRVEQAFWDLELGSSAARFQTRRQHSIASAPEQSEAWSIFRCTPSSALSMVCPKTARMNLELLEGTLRNHEIWSSWSPRPDEADFAGQDLLTVMQLHESSRDKLLAITQSFLHRALDVHRGHNPYTPPSSAHSPGGHCGSNIVLLPPTRVLELFLRNYCNAFESYYPLTARSILDANELLHCYNDKASSLLVLMMIALGASNAASKEARLLTNGLTEACRISLFDLIERNVVLSGDPIVLHAALLFTISAAWSGDKMQMDIAAGQLNMYLSMLRHTGMLDHRPGQSSHAGQGYNADRLWTDWVQQETRSRLVYTWAMVDMDMSIFQDRSPLLGINEFATPMPDAQRLWTAKSAAEWSMLFEQIHEFSDGHSSLGSGARPPSLRELFRRFLEGELMSLGIEMTPDQMRLLLHPLQTLVCQYRSLVSCFPDFANKQGASSATSTVSRLQEVQSLLRAWYDCAERYLKANPMCTTMQTSLVMFHLISLNAVVDFPLVERLARGEGGDGSYQALVWQHKRCIQDSEEAVFHCGQVLRHVRAMSPRIRPPFWSGAVYRATLILWCDSLIQREAHGAPFAVDRVSCDHPALLRYITKKEGIPALTRADGSQVFIDNPAVVLQHAVQVTGEGPSTPLSDGIASKLMRLARG